jgi:membrane protease YdiL (CAAX protease family)
LGNQQHKNTNQSLVALNAPFVGSQVGSVDISWRRVHFSFILLSLKKKNMTWFSRLPVLVRVIIFLGCCELCVFAAQFITGFFSFRGPIATNLLLCVLLLTFTFFILRLEGKTWEDAGLKVNSRETTRLAGGTLIGVIMLVSAAWIIKLITGFQWQLNPAFKWTQLPAIFITVFCSAFAQELAFRGYPFFLMLNKWGEWRAQLITAFFFGCMHLSSGMSWEEVLTTMFTTGIGSLLFGMATIRTRRLQLAVGIHFGWNFTQYLLPRSGGENGPGIWLATGGASPYMELVTYIAPYVLIAATAYFMIRRMRKVNPL